MGVATVAFALWGVQSAEALTSLSIQAGTNISVGCGNVVGLINAINTANASSTQTTITLGSECSYTLTTANNTVTSGSDVGSNGLPVITNSKTITIKGDDPTIARSSASGTPAFRIFDIASTGSLLLKDIHVEGGLSSSTSNIIPCACQIIPGPADGANGGGIYNAGTLTLTGSYVVLNATGDGNSTEGQTAGSGGDGGGIFNASTGKLTMTLGSVSANTTGNGGGFSEFGGNGGDGGGIFNANGIVKLTNGATVSGNSTGSGGNPAVFAGRGGNGGGIENEGSNIGLSPINSAPITGLTLNQALVASNTTGAGAQGETSNGPGGNGGGIDNIDGARAVLIASTVKLNTAAGDGGGIYNVSPSTVVRKMGTTVTGNVPDDCVGC
jgi:hypothetical protein